MTHYLAVDLGATSGRTVLAAIEGKQIRMREFTRFENPQVPLLGHVFWDIVYLYDQILKALKLAHDEHIELQSIGIDTWGCDYAFFGADGQLLGQPYCYRDNHTDGAMEQYFEKCLSKQEVYAHTGIQFMPFNSIFQLFTLQKAQCSAMSQAAKILFIPDALIYMLTGEAVCEYTVASTSQLLNPSTGELDDKLLASLGLQRQQFGRMVQPGEVIGKLSLQVQQATGMGAVPVVAVASHDTASAVAAVPASNEHFAYLSCGTWSLLGIESPKPIISDDSLAENFTNEGGLDHTTRFLKNITGLWIFEQCRKEWNAVDGLVPRDVNELNALCLTSSCQSLINPDDPRFAHPASMTAAISEYLTETHQALPATPADYVRVIFRSLAARYREIIDILKRLTGADIRQLNVIGGGSRNQYLMQFAANALQMPVIAGPQEGTALGNALVQARAQGAVASLQELREIVRNSVELKEYLPQ